ncbi:MAG: hypothetical protein AAGA87_08710 [Pseudomonadota bacterium]
MVFVSVDRDVLRVREVPVIGVSVLCLFMFGMFTVAANAEDWVTTLCFTVAGVIVTALAYWLGEVRHYTLDRRDRSLVIRAARLLSRSTRRLDVGDGAYAELVISTDDEDGDVYQAVLRTDDGAVVPLNKDSSGLRGSARIVMALNGGLRAL